MTKTVREGVLELIDTCIEIGNEDELSKNLSLILFDAMLDVTRDN